MVAGLNMLSFDLFGLGRRKDRDISSEKSQDTASDRPAVEKDERAEEPSDREIFFWALSPVI